MEQQLTIFDFEYEDSYRPLNYETKLSKIENKIKNFLYTHHKGQENGISAKELANLFDVSERQIRIYTNNIKKKSSTDFDSSTEFGYFACKPTERRNNHQLVRTKSQLEDIAESKISDIDEILSFCYMLKKKY